MSFLSSPAFLLFLTLFSYSIGIGLFAKTKWVLFNPILLSVGILLSYLMLLEIPYQNYSQAGQYIDFFLQPSIVALAVPLYGYWDKIKKQLFPILASQFVGCVVGILSVVFFAKITGADQEIILSLIPKSVSTPIALEVSKTIGGVPSITATAVMLTGMIGSMFGFKFLHLMKITNPVSQGIAMGTSAHAMGTMKAMEISDKFAAFASVGMIFNGIITAVLAPLVLQWLQGYLS
ncbi:LrgB family protein [Myroides sp. LJL110]